MKYFFISLIWFWKAGVCILTGSKKNTLLFLASGVLVDKSSFRLNDKDRFGFASIIRYWLKAYKTLFTKRSCNFTSSRLIFDNRQSNESLRKDYLKYCKGYDKLDFISRENLIQVNKINAILVVFISPGIFWLQLILAMWVKKRKNLLLLPLEWMETAGLLKVVLKQKFKTIHWFSIYEKETNLCTLIIKSLSAIEIIKHPSPAPLVAHNKVLISDALAIEIPYQKDEVKRFSETMIVKECIDYIPEMAHSYLDQYKTIGKSDQYSFDLGYYSHGGWLRKAKSKEHAVFAKSDIEEELLKIIRKYLDENQQLKFIIYPHPKERAPDMITETVAYYKKVFDGLSYHLVTDDVKTHNEFDKVNTVISYYSTVLFERLFCGFKTILYTKGLTEFPFDGSKYRSICAENSVELEHILSSNLDKPADNFFLDNNLEKGINTFLV